MATNLFDSADFALKDVDGNIYLAKGATVPDATAGYAIGCIFQHTDGSSNTALYMNEGSATSCDFNAIISTAGTFASPTLTTPTLTTPTANGLVLGSKKVYDASSPYTVLSTDCLILGRGESQSASLELRFAANPTTGQIWFIKNAGSADLVIWGEGNGAVKINGATTLTLDMTESYALISDGKNLHIWTNPVAAD